MMTSFACLIIHTDLGLRKGEVWLLFVRYCKDGWARKAPWRGRKEELWTEGLRSSVGKRGLKTRLTTDKISARPYKIIQTEASQKNCEKSKPLIKHFSSASDKIAMAAKD